MKESPGNTVSLRVVDVYGNVTQQSYPIDIAALLPPGSRVDTRCEFSRSGAGSPRPDTGRCHQPTGYVEIRGGLEANDRQITDLTGLEYAVNLKGLLLGDNQISDITPLAKSTIIEGLELHNNNISDISSLAGMVQPVTFVSPWQLGLGSVAPGGVNQPGRPISLWQFGLGFVAPGGVAPSDIFVSRDNSVSDLSPLAGLIHLVQLELYNNNISDISSLAELTHLTYLFLGDNSVSDLSPLAGLIHLVRLELYNNNISDISSLAELTHLTFLHLGDNSVSDLSPLERLTNLDGLDLYGNSVSDLSPLAELNGLTFLQIDGNLVSDLSPLVANTGLGDGDVVYVQENPLSYASIHTHIPILLERGVTVNHDNRAHPALLKISGYNQQGASGVTLAQPFVVAVQDENGSAVEGVQVTFTVTEGGGTLSSTTSTTDANGQASTTLTLGSQPGPNTVEATVDGFEPVTFTATGKEVHADFDGDGTVGFADFVQFAAQFGLSQGDAGYDARYDLDGDGTIGFGDFVIFANAFGKGTSSH